MIRDRHFIVASAAFLLPVEPKLLHLTLSSYASVQSHFATPYCIRVSFLSLTDSFSILQPQPSWPIRYRLSDPGASAISPVHYILPSVFDSGGAIDSSRLSLTLSWYLKAWSTLGVFVATIKPHHHDFASRALFDVYGSQLLDSTAHYSRMLIRLEKKNKDVLLLKIINLQVFTLLMDINFLL